jgi:hypothetical protein
MVYGAPINRDSSLPAGRSSAITFHFAYVREMPASLNIEHGVKCLVLKQVSRRVKQGWNS